MTCTTRVCQFVKRRAEKYPRLRGDVFAIIKAIRLIHAALTECSEIKILICQQFGLYGVAGPNVARYWRYVIEYGRYIARAVPVITGLDEVLCPACDESMSLIMWTNSCVLRQSVDQLMRSTKLNTNHIAITPWQPTNCSPCFHTMTDLKELTN